MALGITERLTESGEFKRGLIGIRMVPLEPEVAEAMGAANVKGLLIEEVVDGYPAKEAGLQHGDIIVQVNQRKVDQLSDLRLEVSKTALGKTVSVKVLRDGQEKTSP